MASSADEIDFTVPPEQEAAAAEARAKAEARRKRVLEGSKKRMGLVSGEQVKAPAVVEGEDTEEATPAASSGSARMQAMRRRRFKKNQAAKEAATEGTESTTTETTTTETTTTETTATTAETCDAAPATPAAPLPPPKHDAPPAATGETRKYKGVAAMRRQKLKEKAAAKTANDEKDEDMQKFVKKKSSSIKRLPVLLHLITILVLFGVGLKFGIDIVVQPHVTVHRELLAPQQHGFGLVNRLMQEKSNNNKNDPKNLLEKQQQQADHGGSSDNDDEFAADDDEEHEPNIDPLFQLDLDLYTQGDGIFMTIARMAVYLHRLNIWFFWEMPLKMIAAVFAIPAKLLKTPPILFLFTLLTRQFAKRILGAGLPAEEGDKKEDVMTMIKNTVVGFLSNTFPTLVEVYDAFTHLRSDMFVVLCGLFCGLAWNHHVVGGGEVASHDEL